MLILSEQQVSVVVVAQVPPLVAVVFSARAYSQPSKKKLDTAFFGETWLRPL